MELGQDTFKILILFLDLQEGNANVSHTDKKGRSAVDEADRYHMNDAAVWLWLAGASTKNLKRAESTCYYHFNDRSNALYSRIQPL